MNSQRLVRRLFACIAILLYGGLALGENAQESVQAKRNPIVFPTSASPQAEAIFLAGVEMLHNFQYDDAIQTFRNAIKMQPNFDMAYWGLAMSYNHPLWGEQEMQAAQGVLMELDKAPATTTNAREKGLIDAVRLLYGNGDKPGRDTAYAEAMGRLYAQYPNDDEVASFYGLALLGKESDEGRSFLLTMKASDVLEQVYARNPEHPGVLHYLVHCYDDPKYAELGVTAADRYEEVARDSAHALHMPSHIYLDLGLWKKFVYANERSWVASENRITQGKLKPGDYDIHGLHTLLWLQYGHLQQGQLAQALNYLRTMEKIYALNPSPMVKWYLAMMKASYVVDAPNWREVSMSLDLEGIELTAPTSDLFASGLASLRENHTDMDSTIKQIGDLVAGRQKASEETGGHDMHHDVSFFTSFYTTSVSPARIMQGELQAMQLLAEGNDIEAVNRLIDAAAEEDKLPIGYGPPVPVKPSEELLGEMYLRLGRPVNAMRAFQVALIRYPNRAASLIGLSEAAKLSGDRETAAKAGNKLRDMRIDNGNRYQAWKAWPCKDCAPPK
jgi:tetratricopeptide (TPR) repeat protein